MNSTTKLLLKVEEAAEVLSLGRSSIYQLISAGKLHAIKVGRSTRIPYREILALIETLEAEQRGEVSR